MTIYNFTLERMSLLKNI